MDQYELYCLVDRLFYDTPRNRGSEQPDFAVTARAVPDGWEHQPSDVWMSYCPAGAELPPQGWKIHLSARPDDAERALEHVWDYCVPRGLAFKFLRNLAVLVMLNSKSAFRGSSGKLATIYPSDEAELELTLKELDGILTGVRGPYILSDLRYADGPLFVRYGGFSERHCLSSTGERVLAIADHEGRLVPDVRGPTFATPSWVRLPDFLEPHLVARSAVTTSDMDYEIESVIQFSNGGGVYLGHQRTTGERVVLKEGRPLAGLDVLGRDAVTRIGHERAILHRLSGLDVVPGLRDHFTLGDHHFLVEELVDANPLQRLIVNRHPLTHPDATDDELRSYADWAVETLGRVERAVAALHLRGVVFNDLHPDNILLAADDRLVLIDFEVATLADEQTRSALAHPGFAAPADRQGVDVDRYALACLMLAIFAPQTTMLLQLCPAKAVHLADLVAATFPVPRATLDPAVRTILGPHSADDPAMADLPMPGVAPWTDVRDALGRAIVSSATPDRDDRLFPGDIAAFRPGGATSLVCGAAGVLYALACTGVGTLPEHETWLCDRALDPAADIGFYDGLHGVAHALETLGHRQQALDTLEACALRASARPAHDRELGLYSGLAGIGLNLLHFAATTGESDLTDRATGVVDVVADRIGGPDDVPQTSGEGLPRAGLMFGSSGPALLFVHAFERTGDPGLLDLASIALRQDLRRCVRADDQTLQVNQGWRTLPYLEEGSAGIALVLERYLRHRPDDELATSLRPLALVARSRYFVQAGLLMGRAGIIAAEASLARSAGGPASTPGAVTAELVRGLGWHALPYAGGLAFPGNQLLRLSMDLGSGTAGVLLALGAALGERPVHLPFLGPPETLRAECFDRREEVKTP
ncbi:MULTISPECIES: class III lanthionine synthetase LanKC [Nocardioides]|uniref:non-specific serine/threonine protein kinase n=1 Tax=Nocardioides vastitatis TaxID=2568655 RepID=A0ABW0ZHF5_9ACTN|nr:class III lanthionine synthetase LanKC [Nocardioides sp.]THI91370.1 lantipeptide synthetase [Nocardioides sp.]